MTDDGADALRVLHLIERELGPPGAVFHIPPTQRRPGTPHIDVAVYRRFQDGADLLVTAGTSTRAQADTHRARIELYMRVPDDLSKPALPSRSFTRQDP